jgi:hypothetical protein
VPQLALNRRLARPALAASLALLCLFTTAPAPIRAQEAEPAHKGVERIHFAFQGRFAEAFFGSLDETGCIVTSVGIFAVEGRTKEKGRPERASTVSITVTRLDACRGLELMGADGTFGFGNGALGEQLVIDQKLRRATLTAPIQVYDAINDAFIDLHVQVTWTAAGDPFRVKEHFHVKQPGFWVNSRFDGTFRRATAAATVWDGSTNLTPHPTDSADTGSVRQGEIIVLR